MTGAEQLAGELLTSPRFKKQLARAAGRQVGRELLGAAPDSAEPDWSYLLSCASVLALAEGQQALDAALRVMESALTAPDATDAHKAAATLLLDRVGNHLAIGVAQRKHDLRVADISKYPAPLRLDVVRSRLELALPTSDGEPLRVSRFQRNMWTALNQVTWVSASAPTSAGKSRVIRMWFADVLQQAQHAGGEARLAVVVPTRALVDEVSADLRVALPFGVQVTSLPWDGRATQSPAEVFVMTQERLHLLQQKFPSLTFDVLFVDEAHKLGDGTRGVLLQQVIDEAVRRGPTTQVIFASPLAEDPEVLLDGAPPQATTRTVDSQAATVTQNLLYANQVRGNRRRWDLDLLLDDAPMRLGQFETPTLPARDSDRLPLVAVALARGGGGNVVYVNTAAEAEKIAISIAEAVGSSADVSTDLEVQALVELVEKTISPKYKLADVLRRGVAFHYGNMPQIVRAAVERLFRTDKLRFLVCTSTLLEGVNLPCRNLFVRGPKRGKGNPMTASDFWNLAGRAGRWGMELEGNIVCVDTSQPGRWEVVPGRRQRQRIKRETVAVFRDARGLAGWINEGAAVDRTPASGDAVYSFLAARVAAGVPLAEVPGLGARPGDLAMVEDVVSRSLRAIAFPRDLIARHAGINPLAMQRLLEAMRTRTPSDLVIEPANAHNSWASYSRAFGLLADVMGADFGESKRQNQLAVTVVSWMTGKPLSYLIASRLRHEGSKPANIQKSTAAAIREVMTDVESVARFRAPKYLACYVDLMKVHFASIGRHDLVGNAPRGLEMQLELGVSSATQVSLMSLGLSRTSAIELYAKIGVDELGTHAVLDWIVNHPAEVSALPELVVREIDEVLRRERQAEGAWRP